MGKTAEKSISIPKERSSSFELLRIISMLMIILHHFSVHGSFDFTNGTNECITGVLALFGKVGVNLFVMISGYFSLNPRLRLEKVTRLIFQVGFYSVLLMIAAFSIGAVSITSKNILKGIFPLIFGKGYWFIVVYLELYLIMPLIAGGMKAIGKRYNVIIIVSLLFLWTVLGYSFRFFCETQDYSFSNLGWFVLMFMIGAFMRLYGEGIPKKRTCAILFLLTGIAYIALRVVYILCFADGEDTISNAIDKISGHQINNPIGLLFAVFLFMFFIQWSMKPVKTVNIIASCMFGVYLLHDNQLFKQYMWEKLFYTKEHSNISGFVPYILAVTAIILASGIIVDLARRKLLEEPLFNSKAAKGFFDKIQSKTDNQQEKRNG